MELPNFEVTNTFLSQFSGRCTINEDHLVRKGDKVGKVRKADNPMIPIRGVCCKACVFDFPRAKDE